VVHFPQRSKHVSLQYKRVTCTNASASSCTASVTVRFYTKLRSVDKFFVEFLRIRFQKKKSFKPFSGTRDVTRRQTDRQTGTGTPTGSFLQHPSRTCQKFSQPQDLPLYTAPREKRCTSNRNATEYTEDVTMQCRWKGTRFSLFQFPQNYTETQHFMEPTRSASHSQQPATDPYPEPDESSVHLSQTL
jgi:hypothetical protein